MSKQKGNHNLINVRMEAIVCLVLVIATFAVYWQVRNHQFIDFDDRSYLLENNHIHAGLTKKAIKWAFSINANEKTYWHPLTWISHMVDIQLFGIHAGSHVTINVLLHILNSILLFFIFRLMTGEVWKSAFVAGLFALHPINVESVAWIAERKNVLSTFFWMLTLLAYIYYAQKPDPYKYLLTFSVFTLGLMAKPMLVTLPCVLLLMDFWPLGRLRIGQLLKKGPEKENLSVGASHQGWAALRLLIEKLPFFLASAIVLFLFKLSVQRPGLVITMEAVPFNLRLKNALVSYINYIVKMFWPKDLAVFYPFPETIPIYQVLGAAFLLAGITYLFCRASKKMPFLVIGWFWYLGTLVPTIGLVQAGLWPALADRWAYVPFIGLFIIIAWSIPELLRDKRYQKVWLGTLAASLLFILWVSTRQQIRYWRDSYALFKHTVEVTANNPVAYNNLGFALAQQGRITEAFRNYSEALRLNPDLAAIHNNMGNVLIAQGNLDDAIPHYAEALRLNPALLPPTIIWDLL
jgi:hypothetical protein